MTTSERKEALFTARLYAEGRILTLSSAGGKLVCKELLATREEADALALENEQLRRRLDVKARPVTLDPEARK